MLCAGDFWPPWRHMPAVSRLKAGRSRTSCAMSCHCIDAGDRLLAGPTNHARHDNDLGKFRGWWDRGGQRRMTRGVPPGRRPSAHLRRAPPALWRGRWARSARGGRAELPTTLCRSVGPHLRPSGVKSAPTDRVPGEKPSAGAAWMVDLVNHRLLPKCGENLGQRGAAMDPGAESSGSGRTSHPRRPLLAWRQRKSNSGVGAGEGEWKSMRDRPSACASADSGM